MIVKREYFEISCSECKRILKVRRDQIKDNGNMCISCAKKKNWEDPEYRKKCSDSHKGQNNRHLSLPDGEANLNAIYFSYKKSAQERGLFFDIDKELFKKITKQNCHYCGCEPNQIKSDKERFRYGYWIHNGIDRLDDNIGYIPENIVPCCKKCNYAKQGMNEQEFLELIKKIYFHRYEENRPPIEGFDGG